MEEKEKKKARLVARLLAVALHQGGCEHEKRIAVAKIRDLIQEDPYLLAWGALVLASDRAGRPDPL